MNDTMPLQQALLNTCQKLVSTGLTRGISGNISARISEGMLITPSGVPYDTLTPKDLVKVTLKGKNLSEKKPSSEWRIHADILRTRKNIHAVVHAHPKYCIALATHQIDIPAFHYMVAVAGGNSIRCADYATFGTQKLSKHVLLALKNRKACLMAHHGMISTGETLQHALNLAVEVEALAEQYWLALQLGEAPYLSRTEMQTVLKKFKDYGTSYLASG